MKNYPYILIYLITKRLILGSSKMKKAKHYKTIIGKRTRKSMNSKFGTKISSDDSI